MRHPFGADVDGRSGHALYFHYTVGVADLQLPAGQWLAFTHALHGMGEHACARAILRPLAKAAAEAVKSPPPAWNPLQLNITAELESSGKHLARMQLGQ